MTRSSKVLGSMYRAFVRTAATALGVGAVLLAVTPAHALTISQLLIPGAVNTFTDNDAEVFINKAGGATTVDVGDVFLGAIEFDTVNNIAIGTGTGNNELTAVFSLQVASVTPLGGGLALFTFEANPTFQADLLARTGIDIGAQAPGTASLVFEDATPDALRDLNTFSNFVAQTSDGTLRLVLAIDPGDISATAPIDLAAIPVLALPGGGLPVSFFGSPGFDIMTNTFGVALGDPVGLSGNAQRPVAPEDFTIRTDATFVSPAAVPWPAGISLMGLGLVALGLTARRKRA
jgi:hypothetical protein